MMRPISKKTRGLLASVALTTLFLGAAPTYADGAGTIKYRQAVMSSIGGHMRAIVAIVRGEAGDPADLALHAEGMAALAALGDRLFPAGSGPAAGKTAALPRIWTEAEMFRAATETFRAETATLAALARAGDLPGVRRQLGVVGKNGCKACHVGFRARQ